MARQHGGWAGRIVAIMALALLVALGPQPAHGQEPATLEARAGKTRVTAGERVTVTLVLQLPAGARPDFTAVDSQFGDVDVLLVGLPEERNLGGGRVEVRARYEVAVFRPGAAQIPSLTVPYATADGSISEVSSLPIALEVVSVIPDGADPGEVRDLKPPIDLPYRAGVSRRLLAMVALSALFVLVAIAVAVRWLQRWRARSVPALVPAGVPLPQAEAAARAELERIGSLGLLDQDDLRTYHALIAACMRRYLSERYGFPAFAMTTKELAARMESLGVDRWPARLVAGLLGECDAVNYGGYHLARRRAESNLAIAEEIIDITREGADPVPAVR